MSHGGEECGPHLLSLLLNLLDQCDVCTADNDLSPTVDQSRLHLDVLSRRLSFEDRLDVEDAAVLDTMSDEVPEA